MPSRRDVVSTVCASLWLPAVAGCSSRDTARIERIAVTSLLDEAVTVDLRVSKDGERRFAETFELGPDSGSETNPAPVVTEPWMETPGRFRLTVEASTTDEQFVQRIPNEGPGCYYVTVQVRRPDLVLFPVDPTADGCGTETA